MRIEESFDSKLGNRIDFANAILKNENIIKGKLKVFYSLREYKKKGSYDILIDMSEHFILDQFMDSLVNAKHAISVVGYYIFDSNYQKSLTFNRESLEIIFALSVGEEQFAVFETVFIVVRYICLYASLKKN